jgi:hypothetical protein
MNRRTVMVTRCRVGLLAGVGALLGLVGVAGAGEIEWGTSYTQAKKAAKESGQLMMIDFWADW